MSHNYSRSYRNNRGDRSYRNSRRTSTYIKKSCNDAWKWISAEDEDVSFEQPSGFSFHQRNSTYKQMRHSRILSYYSNSGNYSILNQSFYRNLKSPNLSYSINMDSIREENESLVKIPEPAVEKSTSDISSTKKKNLKMPSALYDPEVIRQIQAMKKHTPYFMYIITVIQVLILGFSIWKNYYNSGKIIADIAENPMIGPYPSILIGMGARFLPCMQKTNFTGYECPPGVIPKNDVKFIEKNNKKYIYDSTFAKRRFVQDNGDANGIQYTQNNNNINANNYNTNNINNDQYSQTNDNSNWNSNDVNYNQNVQNNNIESNWNNAQNVQSNTNWNNGQYNQNYNTNGLANNYNTNDNTNINIIQSSGVNNRNNTTDVHQYCELADICGLNMKVGDKPNQWYRFIIPIFLHAGVAHLAFNLVFQIRTGFPMEREYGTWRMVIIYMVSGIYGFMFEAKSVGHTPSVGCSGALYGLLACLLLDLIQSWKIVIDAWKELLKLLGIIIVSFSFGLIPYIDNFAHIGGFIMGLLMGTIFLPIIVFSKRGLAIKRISMVLSLFASIFLFFWSFRHFYFNEKVCKWCSYLNCIPIKDGWCNYK